MIADPDDLLTNTEHRDIVISVLNALDSRVDIRLRAAALMEVGVGTLSGDEPGKWIGALLGLAMRICDDTEETKAVIDDFRKAVRDAATKG